jgi:hypothetical protein
MAAPLTGGNLIAHLPRIRLRVRPDGRTRRQALRTWFQNKPATYGQTLEAFAQLQAMSV